MKGNRTNHEPRFKREPKYCEVCHTLLVIRDTIEQRHKRFHKDCLPRARKLGLINFNDKEEKNGQD